MKENKKPYIILSAAMTIDGKIASKTGYPELSNEEDWKEVHKLRTKVDAIMVGKGTILKDNPKLHIKFYEHSGYTRIVIDSKLSIPINSNVITYEPNIYKTIICTIENVALEKISQFKEKGVEIIKSGKGNQVDVVKLMKILYDKGIKKILLEGGGTLNWSFIKEDLIDEIRLTIAPWIVGGKNAVSLVEGKGFDKMREARKFKLEEIINRNDYVVLKYIKKEKN
ncbi:MAG: 2,5-diamino-6-(ribosylamino)-4(3H)-pyrimidinone 5'-phosphate reductase [Promethearchaeota archaeon]